MPKDSTSDPELDTNKPVTVQDLITLLQATSGVQNELLVRAFSEAMRQNAPRKKVAFAEYDPKTPWHPKKADTIPLTRTCYQNGFLLREEQLSNREIILLNKLDRSGRYIDRLVEVILRDEGSEDVIEIRYRNKTPDQRNDIVRHCRSLEDMLTQIIAAQDVAEAELVATGRPQTRRRRPYVEPSPESGAVTLT